MVLYRYAQGTYDIVGAQLLLGLILARSVSQEESD
jgi:hypothetical protein